MMVFKIIGICLTVITMLVGGGAGLWSIASLQAEVASDFRHGLNAQKKMIVSLEERTELFEEMREDTRGAMQTARAIEQGMIKVVYVDSNHIVATTPGGELFKIPITHIEKDFTLAKLQ